MSVTEISPISTMYTSIYTVTGLPGKYKYNTIFDMRMILHGRIPGMWSKKYPGRTL